MLKEKVDVNMGWYFFLLMISTFLIIMFPISLSENGRLRKENEKLEERIKGQSMLIEYLENDLAIKSNILCLMVKVYEMPKE